MVVRTEAIKDIDPMMIYTCASSIATTVKRSKNKGRMKTPTPITICNVTIPIIQWIFLIHYIAILFFDTKHIILGRSINIYYKKELLSSILLSFVCNHFISADAGNQLT